jgi:hypothetical protein
MALCSDENRGYSTMRYHAILVLAIDKFKANRGIGTIAWIGEQMETF